MTRVEMADVMEKVFEECKALRAAGQAEYAHQEDNAFANFERVAERTGLSRETALLVYAEKHIDGIHSWVQGHRSQRENVRGRINDLIVYMCLLRGMVDELDRDEPELMTTGTSWRFVPAANIPDHEFTPPKRNTNASD